MVALCVITWGTAGLSPKAGYNTMTFPPGVCESESHLVLSDSLWPHRLYSPWNSPGQNIGVGPFSSVQSLSRVRLFAAPWTAACQASLSIISSQSLLELMSMESVMPSSYLILCCPLPLMASIFPSIRVFSSESVLHISWPKYWSFSVSISPSNEYSELIPFRTEPLDCSPETITALLISYTPIQNIFVVKKYIKKF